MPFLPIPSPHPSQTHLSPPPPPSPLILSMCPLSLCFKYLSYSLNFYIHVDNLYFLNETLIHFFWKILFTYFQREGKGGRKRGRETSMCKRSIDQLPLACPQPEPGLQPRHVPWPRIKSATFPFVGWHPTHRALPVGAILLLLMYYWSI